jgi:GNAT superfamily N-acetyltransferase
MDGILIMEFYPVTPDRWHDFEKLFGQRGACGGCWCMFQRLKRAEFEEKKGLKNKLAMKKIIASGNIPGILAYFEGKPIGWCSVGPREDYPALERSRILKRVDDQPVWSIVCLFIARPYRKRGVSVRLLQAAVDYARENGVTLLEGYPFDLTGKKSPLPDPFVWTGLVSAYRKAGFVEVLRRSPARPIMRCYLEEKSDG